MLVVDKIEATMESHCTCTRYDDELDEWTEEPSDYCYGCWDDAKYDFTENLLYPWYAANNYHDNTPIKIVGTRMTWMSRSGYKETYAKDILDDLMINGEFTLRWTLEGDKLSCIRSSHDEMGAHFEFELRDEEEY